MRVDPSGMGLVPLIFFVNVDLFLRESVSQSQLGHLVKGMLQAGREVL